MRTRGFRPAAPDRGPAGPTGCPMADNPNAEMTIWEHLEELRFALLRSLLYIALGTGGAWLFRNSVFWALEWPAWQGARWAGLSDFNFRIFEPVGGLLIMMYASLIVGVVGAAPLWLWELFRFVNPALTPRERRLTYWFIPGFIGLFVAGVLFCYFLAPVFCWFLLRFNLVSFQVAPEWTLGSYLRFLLQCLVATGILFELPMVVMFLVWIGVTTSAALRRRWRNAAVIILIVVAIVTPTTDPVTMAAMGLPLIGLYFLSITLARWVERAKREVTAADEGAYTPTDDDPYGLRGGGQGLSAADEGEPLDAPTDAAEPQDEP